MRNLVLLLALLALAAPAAAQIETPPPRPRASVSLFTGARVPYDAGVLLGFDAAGDPLFQLEEKRSGNPILGVEGQLRLIGPLSLVGAGAYSRGGEREFFVRGDTLFGQPADLVVRSGSDVLFARIGLSARIDPPLSLVETRARPATELFAGLAMVRELTDNHPALNLGFKGTLPLGHGIEFMLGLEDYLVFWNQAAMQVRTAEGLRGLRGAGFDALEGVQLFYDTSNILLLRTGLSLRR